MFTAAAAAAIATATATTATGGCGCGGGGGCDDFSDGKLRFLDAFQRFYIFDATFVDGFAFFPFFLLLLLDVVVGGGW